MKLIKYSYVFFLSTFFCLIEPYSIVFVHIGKEIPSYLCEAASQARLFNENARIYLLANESAIEDSVEIKLQKEQVIIINLECLTRTKEHATFLKNNRLNSSFRQGFWLYTSERFLYLYDFVKEYQISDIIHLESDNMIYVDFNELMSTFSGYYPGMAATLDNDKRCIPGLVYFSNQEILKELAQFFAENATTMKNDMNILALFFHKKTRTKSFYTMPIIMPEYVETYGLKSAFGEMTNVPQDYYNHIDEFNSIFDAASLGQYLGGIDPRNGMSKPGFINESCLFNPSLLNFEWKKDLEGRNIPYAVFNNKYYRINNLHVHSKKLEMFSSKLSR